ncbi:MAG: hypothetical protein IT490_06595 [Candidatus Contendobacter sp.]|nr:hypothetical protein [Candidatus Contendobacter sp.]
METIAIILLFVVVAFTTISNFMLVLRLRDSHQSIFEANDRPSYFYFVGGQWMSNEKYFSWLWSPEAFSLNDEKLSWLVRMVRYSLLVFFGSLIFLVFSLAS